MALNKDWKDYDPVTSVGDPSTPITAAALEDLERRISDLVATAVAPIPTGRPVYDIASTFITLSSTYFNADIHTTANTPVTIRVPLNLGGSGTLNVGIRQMGTGAVTVVWDAGVEVAAPLGTQLAGQFAQGYVTWRAEPNKYVLDGAWTTAPTGSGGGTPPPSGGTTTPVPDGFLAASSASVASGVAVPIPSGGSGDRTYVAVVGWDTGSTPDISSVITTATSGWTKREAGYGTGNGGAVFTCDRTAAQADPSALVLTWTGGARTTFDYIIGVYNGATYNDSDVLVHATADATAPVHPSVPVVTGGQHIIAATNSAGLQVDPPAGYTERVDLSAALGVSYADIRTQPLTSISNGTTQLVLPTANPGDTLLAILFYDNANSGGDPNSGLTLTATSGNWAKKASATKWVSPFGSTVFQHRVAAGDVAPTIGGLGTGARGVGYIVIRVTGADATDAIQAFAVNGNASADTSNAVFTGATDVANGLRLLVEVNNGNAVITAPTGYTQRANFNNQGAVFSRTSDATSSNITFRSKVDVGADNVTGDGVDTYVISGSKPAGAAVGDVHLLILDTSDDLGTAYTVPGWTLLGRTVSAGNGGTAYYYRVEDGTAFQDITFVNTGGGTNYINARILCYQNVDPASPVVAFAAQANAGSTTVTAPSITTVQDGSMLIWVGTNLNGEAITGPATYTARYTGSIDEQPYEKLQTTAGATGTVTGTQPSATPSIGAMIALRPLQFTNTTGVLTGTTNRLWDTYSIIVKPAAALSSATLGLYLADRGISTTGTTGTTSPAMAPTPNRSNVAFSVSLSPTGVVTNPGGGSSAFRDYGAPVVSSYLDDAGMLAFLKAKFTSWTPRYEAKDAQMFGDGGAGLRKILTGAAANNKSVPLHAAIWWNGTDTRASTLAITGQAAMKAAVEARITELISTAKPYNTPRPQMDVINEPFADNGSVQSGAFATAYGGANTTALYQCYRDAALKARALWPELKLGVNEFLPDAERQAALLAMATRFGPNSTTTADRGLLDYVGFQWHPDSPPGLSQGQIETIIDQFGAIGVTVKFTEIGIPSDTSSDWQNLFLAMGRANVDRGTIWGPTDAQSDVSGGSGSMPYNGDYTSKAYATYPETWAAGNSTTPPTSSITTALSSNGGGIKVTSVPTDTQYVMFAVMDNVSNPTNVIYSGPTSTIGDVVPVATATNGSYVFTPPSGYPVVDAIALDTNKVGIGTWAGRLTTNVINTPGQSAPETVMPPASQIVDTLGATWTLVSGVVYRNGNPTISSDVVKVVFDPPNANDRVLQTNTAGGWWYWDNTITAGNQWVQTTDPYATPGGGGSGGGTGTASGYFVGVNPPGNWGYPFADNMKASGLYPWCRSEGRQAWLDQWSAVGGKFAMIFLFPNTTDQGGLPNAPYADLTAVGADAAAQSYANELLAVCNRYKPLAAEVTNEPLFYANGNNHAAYVNLCKHVYQTFKAAGSPCKIIASWDGGGTGPTGVTWGGNVTAAGLGQWCDGVTIHNYAGANNAYANDLGGNDADRSKVIDCWNSIGKPIWITELGWPEAGTGDSPGVSDDERAARITSFNDWVIANHRDKVQCFMYYHMNGAYGVWRDTAPRGPSAAALAAAMAKAANTP